MSWGAVYRRHERPHQHMRLWDGGDSKREGAFRFCDATPRLLSTFESAPINGGMSRKVFFAISGGRTTTCGSVLAGRARGKAGRIFAHTWSLRESMPKFPSVRPNFPLVALFICTSSLPLSEQSPPHARNSAAVRPSSPILSYFC
jgi:hypothetical protein